ncbi:MAG: MerR family transcriptional regulator [Bifidobacteriaceae bacterium]|jgi:DNA-binding transcriptional MerR regulator|nr:MerR family transcriptional regulator [Bifidobacteriaceae bacterium]
MTYSIKDVSERTGLSIYTLRYYDKQGLLPFVARNSAGYREFTDGDLLLLHTICCLKNTGMKISDIRRYIDFVMEGPSSVAHRRALLESHRAAVQKQLVLVRNNLKEIDAKLAIYSAPDAAAKVSQELQAAVGEKTRLGLANTFEKASAA